MITDAWFWTALTFIIFVAGYQLVVWWRKKWHVLAFVAEDYSARFSFVERCNKYVKLLHRPALATLGFAMFSVVVIAGYGSAISSQQGEMNRPQYESEAMSAEESEEPEEYLIEAEPALAIDEPEDIECVHPDDDADCESHDWAAEAEKKMYPVDVHMVPAVRAPDKEDEARE